MKISKKIKKIFLILLTIIMAIFTIRIIVETYAVFYSQMQASSEMELAKWNITVNSEDIDPESTQEFIIDILEIEENEKAEEGKLAPSLAGNFTIEINPNDTQVSIKYDLTLDLSELEGNTIRINSITEENAGNTLIQTAENTYTGVILLEENNIINNIKITFEWVNNEENNEQDTSLGTVINAEVQIPVSISFSQYFGEEIVEWTE